MNINLIDHAGKLEDEHVRELEDILSKVPRQHLAISSVVRNNELKIFDTKVLAYVENGNLFLSDMFYNEAREQREFNIICMVGQRYLENRRAWPLPIDWTLNGGWSRIYNNNLRLDVWQCNEKARIGEKSFKYGFDYGNPCHTPLEEMAECYALHILNNEGFLRHTTKSNRVKEKHGMIEKLFENTGYESLSLIRHQGFVPQKGNSASPSLSAN